MKLLVIGGDFQINRINPFTISQFRYIKLILSAASDFIWGK